ncbi:hypothetical protein Tco_0538349 [Tanacetum coccineum]
MVCSSLLLARCLLLSVFDSLNYLARVSLDRDLADLGLSCYKTNRLYESITRVILDQNQEMKSESWSPTSTLTEVIHVLNFSLKQRTISKSYLAMQLLSIAKTPRMSGHKSQRQSSFSFFGILKIKKSQRGGGRLEMDLLAFIRTADPTKVRIGERQRGEDEPKLLDTTVGRTVPLLPVAPARAQSELDASVDKLFDEEGSDNEEEPHDSADVVQSAGTLIVSEAAEVVGEDVIPLRPRQKKRKTNIDAGEPSHPAKKLRDDYGAPGGPSVADFSHYSSANIAEAEVDSIAKSAAPIIATVVTTTADVATTSKEAPARETPAKPSLFAAGSSSDGGTDPTPGGFSDVYGSDFLVGGIRTVVDPGFDLQKVYVPQWSVTNGSYLDDGRVCHEIEEKSERLFCRGEGYVVEDLLKVKKIVKFLRGANVPIEEEKGILNVKVTDLAATIKVREQEAADSEALVTAVKSQNDSLVDQEKRSRIREYADIVAMVLHLEEKFYPHLLNTIAGRRWLLTHGMELVIAKCLNSTEYLSALGAAIGKAIEKGMQEGLSAGITHGIKGRTLTDVTAYNPSAEADYLAALYHLQSVNFSLLAELKSNKDARTKTIMNLLRLEDHLAD